MVLTMNRPERFNAITGAMLIRMYDAYQEASNDPDVRCIVITGAGGNFCSGADLRAMAGDSREGDPMDTRARMAEDPDIVYKALFRHYRPTKPIIAAVEGVAIAGGTEILQAMEIRVAAESARFGVSEARWSLYPMGGSAVRLPRQIPYTQAAEILLTAKHISASEAKEIGLIGHVVPDGTALDKGNGNCRSGLPPTARLQPRRSLVRCTSATGWNSTRLCVTSGTTDRLSLRPTMPKKAPKPSPRSANPTSPAPDLARLFIVP